MTLSEKLLIGFYYFVWGEISRRDENTGKVTKHAVTSWRVWWLFTEVSRRFPMPLLSVTVAFFLVSVWFSLMYSGAVGAALAAGSLLMIFQQLQLYFPKIALAVFVGAVLFACVASLDLGTADPISRRDVYQFLEALAGEAYLKNLFTIGGVITGAVPFALLSLCYNITIVGELLSLSPSCIHFTHIALCIWVLLL